MSAVSNNIVNDEFVLPSDAQSVRVVQDEATALLKPLLDTLESLKTSTKATQAAAPQASGTPSNEDMKKAYAMLMELLGQLQVILAKYKNEMAQGNANAGTALMKEMEAAFTNTMNKIKEAEQKEANASFWTKLAQWFGYIIAAITFVVAVATGQFALAAITVTFTVLAASGAMEKITKGIADLISQSLVKDWGMSKEDADKIAKVIADIIVIAATIIITAATCGAGSASTIAKTAVQGGAELTGATASTIAAQTAETVAQSVTDQIKTLLSKIFDVLKECPRLSYSIAAGTQALSSTSFVSDMLVAATRHMKDGKEKEQLQIILGIILNLLAAIGGGVASAAVCMGSQTSTFLNNALKKFMDMLKNYEVQLSTALKALAATQLVAGSTQAGFSIQSGAIQIDLANTIKEKGEAQALLTLLQQLIKMNSDLTESASKSAASEQKARGKAILELDANLTKGQEAAAQQLLA